ncbi:sigma-70 family RNA polymerase sigma factor [Clostridium sp. C105KSO13]|uniref:sigma-70 family RNA polymerase sigma factor n=1 Tax=Clostridium sp. C105KSO13 TaxID=1776045 RepID=UPI00074063F1|nr:sigma-70 family RNA polymerase sigma factor [Clostridium sp. C105KSO13]CUX25002.1 hypothetical protein BN3456_00778 [Clostridium sp. C105KSO13]
MSEKNTYTGSKVQNHFTAYLLEFIRGRRRSYLDKKIKQSEAEHAVEDMNLLDSGISFDELIEMQAKETMLMKEADGTFPRWEEMTDQRLVKAMMILREEELRFIYQHVFEERSFEEMSRMNNLSVDRAKGIYYYAIRKIRKVMGEKRDEF